MARSRTNRGIVLLGLMLQLIASAGPSVALCVAGDGHTALEVAHAQPYCLTDYCRHHSDSDEVSDIDQHRCCTDIVMSQIPLPSAHVSHPGAALSSVSICLSGAAIPTARSLVPWQVVDALMERDPRLPSRRTVVLTV